MPADQPLNSDSRAPAQTAPAAPADPADRKQRALALGLEMSKRAGEASSLDELYFTLTNDLRILLPFDRALLLTHIGSQSEFVAATNQPSLQAKLPVFKAVAALAGDLRFLDKGVLLSAKSDAAKLSEEALGAELRERIISHMQGSGLSYLPIAPLSHNKRVIGHLLLEFYEETPPPQVEALTLLSVTPLLAAALAEKWFVNEKPSAWANVFATRAPEDEARARTRRMAWIAAAVAVAFCLLFLAPFTQTVGGEAEVTTRERRLAFVKIDGLIERVDVREGAVVEKGQSLASLDPRDLEHEIQTAKRRVEILARESALLQRESGQDPSKLGESELVKLKRSSAAEELQYLQWKTQFLEVKAPESGVVVTKDVESLAGKKFRAGEPFCEIGVHGDIEVAALVPEDRISLVKKGQSLEFYLNSDPSTGFPMVVDEIAPIAVATPRLGNVYKVEARFVRERPVVKVGMKGIARIDVREATLFRMAYQRFLSRWNQFSIYLP